LKIKHLRIQNYRSIKWLDLAPGDLTALVGPNNAGKTNILSALNFLLGERFPTIQGLEDKDFYGKARENELHIKAWFEPGPERIVSVFVETSSGGRELRARYRERRLRRSRQACTTNCGPRLVSNSGPRWASQFGRASSRRDWRIEASVRRRSGRSLKRCER
jgi:recombinational DNA repair ATPase RecF